MLQDILFYSSFTLSDGFRQTLQSPTEQLGRFVLHPGSLQDLKANSASRSQAAAELIATSPACFPHNSFSLLKKENLSDTNCCVQSAALFMLNLLHPRFPSATRLRVRLPAPSYSQHHETTQNQFNM